MTLRILALCATVSAAVSTDIPSLTDTAAKARLAIRVVSGNAESKKFIIESIGGGLAVIDYNRDGWMDLYVVNGSTIREERTGRHPFRSALYRNNRDGTFTDVTVAAKVPNSGWGKGALAADLDGDGWQDLYVLNFGRNVLYLNNGDGTFRDATNTSGLGDPRWSSAAAAADYDGDGDLDVFVANYLDYDLNNLPTEGKFCTYLNVAVSCGPRGLKGAGDALYRNNGDGTFTDLSVQAGVADAEGYYGLGAAWGDYDNDGDPDLFVANDATPNYLYRNNGDGTLTDVAVEAGVAFSEDGREQSGMGVEFEDLDNDGWQDIMVTNFSEDYNTLYRNTGKGYFRDDSARSGLVADSWRDLSWGVGFADFNNDGWKDVFVANGHIYPEVDRTGAGLTYRQRNKLYLNTGGTKLANVSTGSGPALASAKSWRGAVFADFNNDGAIDVAASALDDSPALMMNQPRSGAHWILVKLESRAKNRDGVGARVSIRNGDFVQSRQVRAGGSFASSSDLRMHFGTGPETTVDEITIRWPSGRTQRLEHVKTDRMLTVTEP